MTWGLSWAAEPQPQVQIHERVLGILRIPLSRGFRKQASLIKAKVAQSCLTPRPHGLYSPWNPPGQDTGAGSLSLLQGISPPRDRTRVSSTAGGFFTSGAIREDAEVLWSSPKIVSLVKLLLEHGNSFFVYVKVFGTAASLNLPSWQASDLPSRVSPAPLYSIFTSKEMLASSVSSHVARGADGLALAPVEFPIPQKGLLLCASATGLVCIELRPLKAHMLRSTLLLGPLRL